MLFPRHCDQSQVPNFIHWTNSNCIASQARHCPRPVHKRLKQNEYVVNKLTIYKAFTGVLNPPQCLAPCIWHEVFCGWVAPSSHQAGRNQWPVVGLCPALGHRLFGGRAVSPSSPGPWCIVGALKYLFKKFLHYPFKFSFATHDAVMGHRKLRSQDWPDRLLDWLQKSFFQSFNTDLWRPYFVPDPFSE